MNGENGFEKNMEKAVEQIERAAGLNLPAGIYHLAHLKEQGQGVEENLGEALELYCKAADMGK
jgi:TPR repeat protein